MIFTFDVFGQKIVNINDNSIYSVELLARLKDGRIIDLDVYFENLDPPKALRWFYYQLIIASQFTKTENIPCSVNLDNSVLAIADPAVVNVLSNNKKTILELTQVQSLPLIKTTNIFKNKLNNNISISIDDFNFDQYNTFKRVIKYDINAVKLDKSVIANIATSKHTQRLLVKFKKKLTLSNLHCIVEGVENKEQHDILKDIGFNLFQGYYMHRPELLLDLITTR